MTGRELSFTTEQVKYAYVQTRTFSVYDAYGSYQVQMKPPETIPRLPSII